MAGIQSRTDAVKKKNPLVAESRSAMASKKGSARSAPAFLPFAIIINTSEDDELRGILSAVWIYPAKKPDEA